MNDFENLCVCPLNECKLYLENPIALPCGFSICKIHVETNKNLNNEFDCSLCNEKHPVPDDGFQVNISLKRMIDVNRHLDGIHKKVKQSFDNLELYIDDYNKNHLFNHENYIFEYFCHLRNKIDLHREQLIKDIQIKSDTLIEKLNQMEKECKLNAENSVEKIDLDDLKNEIYPNLKSKLRNPSIKIDEIEDLLETLELINQDIEFKINLSKLDSLMYTNIDFIEYESTEFGELSIYKQNFKFTRDCGKCLRTLQGHHKFVTCSIYIKELRKIVSCSKDKTIKIWDIDSGECLSTLEGHESQVNMLISLSKNHIASCSYDKTIKIWNIYKNVLITTLIDDFEIFCLALSPSKHIIYNGCENGIVSMWHLKSLSKIKSFKAHNDLVTSILYHKDNTLITSSINSEIRTWNLITTECIQILSGHTSQITCLELLDANKLLSGSNDGRIRVWDLFSGECLKSIKFASSILSIKKLSEKYLLIAQEKYLYLFDFFEKRVVRKFAGHFDDIFWIDVVQGNQIISGSKDKTINIWSL